MELDSEDLRQIIMKCVFEGNIPRTVIEQLSLNFYESEKVM
jgi:hypothetical protein